MKPNVVTCPLGSAPISGRPQARFSEVFSNHSHARDWACPSRGPAAQRPYALPWRGSPEKRQKPVDGRAWDELRSHLRQPSECNARIEKMVAWRPFQVHIAASDSVKEGMMESAVDTCDGQSGAKTRHLLGMASPDSLAWKRWVNEFDGSIFQDRRPKSCTASSRSPSRNSAIVRLGFALWSSCPATGTGSLTKSFDWSGWTAISPTMSRVRVRQ